MEYLGRMQEKHSQRSQKKTLESPDRMEKKEGRSMRVLTSEDWTDEELKEWAKLNQEYKKTC